MVIMSCKWLSAITGQVPSYNCCCGSNSE